MNFEKGQLVKHKVNDQKMIVIGTRTQREELGGFFNNQPKSTTIIKENQVECRYERKNEREPYLISNWFYPEELTLLKEK